MWRSIIILAVVVFTGEAVAQQVKITAQARPRAEFRNGFRTLGATYDPAFFVSQRTRLTGAFSANKIDVVASFQNVRVWGEQGQTQEIPSLSLFEGYFAFRPDSAFLVKVGRQTIDVADQRILGSLDWAQQARAHDAVTGAYVKGKWAASAGLAYSQTSEKLFDTYFPGKDYKYLMFASADRAIKSGKLSALYVTDGFQNQDSTGVNFRHTFGATAFKSLSFFDVSLSAFGQLGKNQQDQSVSGYMINAFIKRNLGNASVTLGGDLLSGTAYNTNASGTNSFNTLYATNHKFYGFMDYFLNVPNDTKGGGLVDLYASFGYPINKKAKFLLSYHYFSLDKKVAETQNELYLASEIDTQITYRVNPSLAIVGGVSALRGSEQMELIKSGDSDQVATWAWVMVNATPSAILSTK